MITITGRNLSKMPMCFVWLEPAGTLFSFEQPKNSENCETHSNQNWLTHLYKELFHFNLLERRPHPQLGANNTLNELFCFLK